jgi:hypothetical protein
VDLLLSTRCHPVSSIPLTMRHQSSPDAVAMPP